jgi:aryl-alcohol dehydrogenase-like predicted oxidoreductase
MVKQRPLGNSGLVTSEIGLGCWQLGGDWGPVSDAQVSSILSAADAVGVTFWDTADVYGSGVSEMFIGNYTQSEPKPSRVIVTKAGRSAELYPQGYTQEKLRAAINASRARLQVDTLAMVQLHCIPFAELQRGDVFRWLDGFKQEGLIAHYGASVETVEEALFCLNETGVASLQLIFNLLRQDMAAQVLPLAQSKGVGVIVRLGLASGLLAGKMTKEQQFSPQDHRSYNQDGAAFHVGETFSGLPFELAIDLIDQLRPFVPVGMNMAQLALRWLLDHEAVSSVITGASSAEQIQRNAEVSNLPALTGETHQQLAEFYQRKVREHIRGTI